LVAVGSVGVTYSYKIDVEMAAVCSLPSSPASTVPPAQPPVNAAAKSQVRSRIQPGYVEHPTRINRKT